MYQKHCLLKSTFVSTGCSNIKPRTDTAWSPPPRSSEQALATFQNTRGRRGLRGSPPCTSCALANNDGSSPPSDRRCPRGRTGTFARSPRVDRGPPRRRVLLVEAQLEHNTLTRWMVEAKDVPESALSGPGRLPFLLYRSAEDQIFLRSRPLLRRS